MIPADIEAILDMSAAAAAVAPSTAAAAALAPASAAVPSRADPPYVWQLNLAVDSADDTIVWSAYSAAESAILEAARARKEKMVVLSDTHKADLVKMRQMRRDDPKRWRRIRRLEGAEAAEWIKENERAQSAALLIEDPLRASVNRHRLRVQQLIERILDGRQPGEVSMSQLTEIKQAVEEFKVIETQAKKAGLNERLPAVLTEVQQKFMSMLPDAVALDEAEAAERAQTAHAMKIAEAAAAAAPGAAAAMPTAAAASASAFSSSAAAAPAPAASASAPSADVTDPLPDVHLPAALKLFFEDANTAFGLPFLAPPLRDIIVSYARSHAGSRYTVAQAGICEECHHEEGVPVFPFRWGGQVRRMDEADMRAYCYAQIFEAAQATMLVAKYASTWRKYGAACVAKKYARTSVPELIRIVQAVETSSSGQYFFEVWPLPSFAIRDVDAKDDGEVDEEGDWHEWERGDPDAPPQVRLCNTTLWMRDGVELGVRPRNDRQFVMVTQLRGLAAAPELQLPSSLHSRLEDAMSRHIGAPPVAGADLFPLH